MKQLNSTIWPEAMKEIRECHVSMLSPAPADVRKWTNAFGLLMQAVKEERAAVPGFAKEIADITEETECTFDFPEILEIYFDFLEENDEWEYVIEGGKKLIEMFEFKKTPASEFKFRIGNALQMSKRLKDAEQFGKQWLEESPSDLYAAASNVFLLASLERWEEAEALTKKYLPENLVCNEKTETIYMAAYRLYEMTDNVTAKERVAKKIAEYSAMCSNK